MSYIDKIQVNGMLSEIMDSGSREIIGDEDISELGGTVKEAILQVNSNISNINVFPDFTAVETIDSIASAAEQYTTWTATEDCWVGVVVSAGTPYLKVNSVSLNTFCKNQNFFPVKKGDSVEYGHSTYSGSSVTATLYKVPYTDR